MVRKGYWHLLKEGQTYLLFHTREGTGSCVGQRPLSYRPRLCMTAERNHLVLADPSILLILTDTIGLKATNWLSSNLPFSILF
ncbi:hypothetical protein L1987_49717 [Smallanthus sonchifolius]|uniref:Uncharacterized protein n=1 Tax=Smallanthus sonchifolius TaxID=185202 RepID=A0ACB9FUW0_9ASTR|nr:hypothetical protein L1987_49717 [Smallanthus sonchifolius]